MDRQLVPESSQQLGREGVQQEAPHLYALGARLPKGPDGEQERRQTDREVHRVVPAVAEYPVTRLYLLGHRWHEQRKALLRHILHEPRSPGCYHVFAHVFASESYFEQLTRRRILFPLLYELFIFFYTPG